MYNIKYSKLYSCRKSRRHVLTQQTLLWNTFIQQTDGMDPSHNQFQTKLGAYLFIGCLGIYFFGQASIVAQQII